MKIVHHHSISIDLRMISASGVGTYLRNLLPLVIKSCSDYKFTLLGNVQELNQFHWAQNRNISLVNYYSPIYSVAEQFELPRIVPKDTSFYWSTHYNAPLLYFGKLLVNVHDLCHIALPHYLNGVHKQLYARGMLTALKYKANSILCISQFTSNELVRLVGVRQEKINTTYCGVDASWFDLKQDKNPHVKPFLLYVGNIKPHKNLVALLQAFALLIEDIPHDLVVVGKKEGFITGDESIAAVAADLASRIKFTGYVQDEVLKQYFFHADALVFPSLYEGFGLPPLEAMACGCPVVASHAASVPEVCGDAVLYCDPYNPKDIAEKISVLVQNSILRQNLRQKGIVRARQFTWEKCARETVAVIEKVLAS